jgi:hypothetical protein
MSEALRWTAAVVVLVAYALSLMGVCVVGSLLRYLASNLIGGFGLPAAAVISHQWGLCSSRAFGGGSRLEHH